MSATRQIFFAEALGLGRVLPLGHEDGDDGQEELLVVLELQVGLRAPPRTARDARFGQRVALRVRALQEHEHFLHVLAGVAEGGTPLSDVSASFCG